jgi:soluble lytic murein transglycosylase-like protein
VTRESQWYAREIEAAAKLHHLDPQLVEAVVLVESSGRASAYRYEPAYWRRYLEGKPAWKGKNPRRVAASYGLMQVMFPTAVERGYHGEPEELFVPSVGLEFGCRELARLLAWASGNTDQALAAYNGGQGGWRGRAPQQYVQKVRAWRAEIAR